MSAIALRLNGAQPYHSAAPTPLTGEPPSPSPATIHYRYLDGLRAAAALYVVIHHLWQFQFGTGARETLFGRFTNWLLYGHFAVDLFIVLSGFCLMLPVLSAGSLKGGALSFLKRRARRIFPPYLVSLLVFTVIALLIQRDTAIDSHRLMRALVVNLLLFQDVIANQNIFNESSWSVALEWKVYFTFPAMLMVWRKWGIGGMTFFSMLLAAGYLGFVRALHPHMTLGHTCPWYFLLFDFGVCAAVATTAAGKRRDQILCGARVTVMAGSVALAALIARYPVTTSGEDALFVPHLPLIDTVAGILAASLLVLCHSRIARPQPGMAMALLSSRPAVFLGTFAYSLYLVQFPLIQLAKRFFDHHRAFGLSPDVAPIVFMTVTPAAVLVVAYGFYLLVERPFTQRPAERRLEKFRWRIPAVRKPVLAGNSAA